MQKIKFFLDWLFTVTKLRIVDRRIHAVTIPLPKSLSRRTPADQEVSGLWVRDCLIKIIYLVSSGLDSSIFVFIECEHPKLALWVCVV